MDRQCVKKSRGSGPAVPVFLCCLFLCCFFCSVPVRAGISFGSSTSRRMRSSVPSSAEIRGWEEPCNPCCRVSPILRSDRALPSRWQMRRGTQSRPPQGPGISGEHRSVPPADTYIQRARRDACELNSQPRTAEDFCPWRPCSSRRTHTPCWSCRLRDVRRSVQRTNRAAAYHPGNT